MPPVPSTETPSSHDPSVRRRARPTIFSRHLFRPSARRQQSALETFPSSQRETSHSPSEDSGSFFSTYLLHRHRHRDNPRVPTHFKPIYIYPGLLRIVRDKAIALDNQCPAVLYKCRECRRDPRQASSSKPSSSHVPSEEPQTDKPSEDTDPSVEDDPDPAPSPLEFSCPHQISCPICLEEFHGKDLVRKLPCNGNHVFHSKCILDWFVSHYRCPLCNEPVISPPLHPSIVSTSLREARADPPHANRGVLLLRSERDRSRARTRVSHPSQASQGDLTLHGERRRSRAHVRLHRQRSASFSQQSGTQFTVLDQSRVHPPLEGIQEPVEEEAEEDVAVEEEEDKAPQSKGKGRKRSRGPRTYSYIVHDNVRMEMNPVIPV